MAENQGFFARMMGNRGDNGSGNNQQNSGNNPPQNTNNSSTASTGNENNASDNNPAAAFFNSGTLWDDPKEPNNANNGSSNTNNNGNNAPANQPPDRARSLQMLDDHLGGAGAYFNIPKEAIDKLQENGDTAGLHTALKDGMRNFYLRTMQDAQQLIDNRVSGAVEEAVQKATGSFRTDRFRDNLNEALPFTKNKVIAPVAESIAARFFKQGASPEEAIDGVREFFKHTSQLSADDLELRVAPRNSRNGGAGFNDSFAGYEPEGTPTNWADVLKGM